MQRLINELKNILKPNIKIKTKIRNTIQEKPII